MSIKKIALLIGVIAVVGVGGFFAIKALFPGDTETTGPIYSTAAVTRGDIQVGVECTGTLNASYGGSLTVPGSYSDNTSYTVEKLYVKSGDKVTAGQPIMKLAAPDLTSQMKTLQEQLDSERESLAAMLNIDETEVDNVNPDSGITIAAPIAGRLSDFNIKAGSELKQGSIVGKVVDDSEIEILVKLTAYEIQQINENTKALVRMGNYVSSAMLGEITEINRNATPELSKSLATQNGFQEDMTGSEFVYHVRVKIDNPGLVIPSTDPEDIASYVNVGFFDPPAGYVHKDTNIPENAFWCRYMGCMEGYVDEEDVLSSVEAIVTKVLVSNNATVEEGDALAILAGQDVRSEIEKRLDSIREKKTELNKLQLQTGSLTITSPSDGMVAELEAKEGGSVTSGNWVGSIFRADDMNMYCQVSDFDIMSVQVGAAVTVTLDSLPDQEFEGTVEYISGMGKDESGVSNFEVSITVKANADVRPGMQARAYINAGSASDVLLVPVEAVFTEEKVDKVEVMNDDGTVSVVAIEVGLTNSRFAEVRSGLEEGQLVVTGSTADLLPSDQPASNNNLLPTPEGGGEEGGDIPEDGGDMPSDDGGSVDVPMDMPIEEPVMETEAVAVPLG